MIERYKDRRKFSKENNKTLKMSGTRKGGRPKLEWRDVILEG